MTYITNRKIAVEVARSIARSLVEHDDSQDEAERFAAALCKAFRIEANELDVAAGFDWTFKGKRPTTYSDWKISAVTRDGNELTHELRLPDDLTEKECDELAEMLKKGVRWRQRVAKEEAEDNED